MAIPVKLYEVIDAFEMLGDDNRAYLNRSTGEVFVVQDEFSADEDDQDVENCPEWQRELILKARDIRDNEDWLALPDKFEIHEWNIMDEFCRSVADERKRKQLMGGIRGSGAFRRFRRVTEEFGMEQNWFAFRAAALERIAIDWLEENGIAYTREPRTAIFAG